MHSYFIRLIFIVFYLEFDVRQRPKKNSNRLNP